MEDVNDRNWNLVSLYTSRKDQWPSIFLTHTYGLTVLHHAVVVKITPNNNYVEIILLFNIIMILINNFT